MKMNKQTIIICLFVVIQRYNAQQIDKDVDLYEFGVKTKGRVLYSIAGGMNKNEKHVNLPLMVDDCVDILYIRVVVINKSGPPVVKYDADNRNVSITYRPKQTSESRYWMVVKGENTNECSETPDPAVSE